MTPLEKLLSREGVREWALAAFDKALAKKETK